jgi:acid ceramidase
MRHNPLMGRLPEIIVDLAAPPRERWIFAEAHVRAGRDLFRIYNDDLGVDADTMATVAALAPAIIPDALLAEMDGIGARLGATLPQVLLANLHYDVLKVVLGCTAFAIDTPSGPLHARNLDWWTTGRALNDATVVTRFINGAAGEFVTVGWPGFVGAFSGVANGRFAVTLNAVLSDEPGQVTMPVVMLIRQVLETAVTFDEAVDRLSRTTIATDCLLLVTGTNDGEMVVIERTPTRHARRAPIAGEPLRVTNDYILIDADSGEPANELMQTSCSRYDRIAELLLAKPPYHLDACIAPLQDDGVMMNITVQQMVFRARTGDYLVRVP